MLMPEQLFEFSEPAKRIVEDTAETTPTQPSPFEGKQVVIDVQTYQYEKAATEKTIWNDELQASIPVYHTLKTWFSHSTPGIGPGPGWDSRHRLQDLTPEAMIERYGHEFSRDEILSAGGVEDFMTGKYEGGMPDDIAYYVLTPIE